MTLFEIFVDRFPRQLLYFMSIFFLSLIQDERRDNILLLAWSLASYSLYSYYPLETHRSLSRVTDMFMLREVVVLVCHCKPHNRCAYPWSLVCNADDLGVIGLKSSCTTDIYLRVCNLFPTLYLEVWGNARNASFLLYVVTLKILRISCSVLFSLK
jgi:hypothetical protein